MIQPLQQQQQQQLTVTLVYISEAHAEDEWPCGNKYRTDKDSPLWTPALDQSRTVEQRFDHAKQLADRFNVPSWIRVAIDLPTDISPYGPFERIYGAWPTGFYLVQNLTLKHASSPCRGMFDPMPLIQLAKQLLG